MIEVRCRNRKLGMRDCDTFAPAITLSHYYYYTLKNVQLRMEVSARVRVSLRVRVRACAEAADAKEQPGISFIVTRFLFLDRTVTQTSAPFGDGDT